MLPRIGESIRFGSITASKDRGRSLVSSDWWRSSSQGFKRDQRRQPNKMMLLDAVSADVILDLVPLLGQSYNNCFRSALFEGK